MSDRIGAVANTLLVIFFVAFLLRLTDQGPYSNQVTPALNSSIASSSIASPYRELGTFDEFRLGLASMFYPSVVKKADIVQVHVLTDIDTYWSTIQSSTGSRLYLRSTLSEKYMVLSEEASSYLSNKEVLASFWDGAVTNHFQVGVVLGETAFPKLKPTVTLINWEPSMDATGVSEAMLEGAFAGWFVADASERGKELIRK